LQPYTPVSPRGGAGLTLETHHHPRHTRVTAHIVNPPRFALWRRVNYIRVMGTPQIVLCDGCGQNASSPHLAARFQRLEWSTRYRPLHINTLLLGAVAPPNDSEFIYADASPFSGEAATLLRTAGIEAAGKTPETIHHEFQRAGLFVAYVLDCPLETTANGAGQLQPLLSKRIPATLTRIRRSIKPKRLALIAPELDAFLEQFTSAALDCSVLLDGSKAFKLDETGEAVERLRTALSQAVAVAR